MFYYSKLYNITNVLGKYKTIFFKKVIYSTEELYLSINEYWLPVFMGKVERGRHATSTPYALIYNVFAQSSNLVFRVCYLSVVWGIVFLTVALGLWPRATAQNIIPSTLGQQFDCSQITYETTVYCFPVNTGYLALNTAKRFTKRQHFNRRSE